MLTNVISIGALSKDEELLDTVSGVYQRHHCGQVRLNCVPDGETRDVESCTATHAVYPTALKSKPHTRSLRARVRLGIMHHDE